jgi:hypothetical protein
MLAGWEAYFHYGSKRKTYRALNAHTRTTVRNFLRASQGVLAGHPPLHSWEDL